MKISERLMVRLRDDLELAIPEGAVLLRTHASRADVSNGAWSWYVSHENSDRVIDRMIAVGSQWPMSTVLESHDISCYNDGHGNIHVVPGKLERR